MGTDQFQIGTTCNGITDSCLLNPSYTAEGFEGHHINISQGLGGTRLGDLKPEQQQEHAQHMLSGT
jgi:hypothetical protein